LLSCVSRKSHNYDSTIQAISWGSVRRIFESFRAVCTSPVRCLKRRMLRTLSSLVRGWLKPDDGSMGWGLDWGGTEQSRTGDSAGRLVVARAGCLWVAAMASRTNSDQVVASPGPTS
jgi:hypothetical protein